MALLQLRGISKRFNDHPALDRIHLDLEEGTILCLLGPSGCGKTTLLRIIAGLEQPDQGQVLYKGRDLAGVPPHLRRFRMMFQEFALFPHKNVFENVAFGLQMQRLEPAAVHRRARQMLNLVGLEKFEERNIAELSGGERQRVALARSLAPDPLLLMLDEPLGSLDRALRRRLVLDLNRILRQVRVTTIFVTHDQAEAFALADGIAVMNAGRIEQVDPPEILYTRPANPAVARFLGFENLVEGILEDDLGVRTPFGKLRLPASGCSPGQRLIVVLRPEAARLIMDEKEVHGSATVVVGIVRERLFQGHYYHLRLATEVGIDLTFHLPHKPVPPGAGAPVRLALQPSAMALMHPDER
jgi:ABC-type Fe3+/spermidine/putrescine transport system ATPase subunit